MKKLDYLIGIAAALEKIYCKIPEETACFCLAEINDLPNLGGSFIVDENLLVHFIPENPVNDRLPALTHWQPYDPNILETRPTEYGTYLVCRKDGKIHWETWNGSGWAYNYESIRYWAVIVPPKHQ